MPEENDSVWDKVIVCADAIKKARDSNETTHLIDKLAAQFEQLDHRDIAIRAVWVILLALLEDRAKWQTHYRIASPPSEDE